MPDPGTPPEPPRPPVEPTSTGMRTYRGFGLGIASEFPLPELASARNGHADITVVAGRVPRGAMERTEYGARAVGACELRLVYDDVVALSARAGRELVVEP